MDDPEEPGKRAKRSMKVLVERSLKKQETMDGAVK